MVCTQEQYDIPRIAKCCGFFIMKAKQDWFKRKGYLHITPKLDPKENGRLRKFITTPAYISRHAFFPLMFRSLSFRRYKKIADENGDHYRSHVDGDGKSTRKKRPIHYATHVDAAIYSYYAEQLSKQYEQLLSQEAALSCCIAAYRRIPIGDGTERCKSNIDFAKEVFDEIKQRGNCVAMAFDIESFFSNLDHDLLKQAWQCVLNIERLPADHFNVFRSVTKFSYIRYDDLRAGQTKRSGLDERRLAKLRQKGIEAFFENAAEFRQAVREGSIRVFKNQRHDEAEPGKRKVRGIPQGLPISAVLANIYLLEFDKALLEEVVKKRGGFYCRYSDDIVVVCSENEYKAVKSFVESQIQQSLLSISASKTEVSVFRHVSEKLVVHQVAQNGSLRQNVPFTYLGFDFYGDKALIKSANLAKFYRRMLQGVKKAHQRRLKVQKKQRLFELPPFFLKRLLKQFSPAGSNPGKAIVQRTVWRKNEFGVFSPVQKDAYRKRHGNFFTYAHKAANTMQQEGIKHQMRGWRSILFSAIRRVSNLQ